MFNKKAKLIKFPNEELFKPTKEVIDFNEDLGKILDQMALEMVKNNGIGISSNQLSYDKKMFVMRHGKEDLFDFINPVVVSQEGYQYINEGCLSAPGVFIQVPRPEQVTIRAKNRKGEEFEVVATGIEAVCIMHEMEHLEGKFFIERAIRQQKRQALKKLGML
jgi:peptide deformylase